MAEELGGQERSEQATPKHLEEARRQGQIARSREFTTMALLLAGSGAMMMSGDRLAGSLTAMMRRILSLPVRDMLATPSVADLFARTLLDALLDFAPLFIVTTLAALLAPLAVGGWIFSAEALQFKWERLDPLAGARRMLGGHGVSELLKTAAKFALIMTVASALLWLFRRELLDTGSGDVRSGFAAATDLVGRCFLVLSATTVVIAVFDVPWQIWSHAQRLRMTRQQVREELKETEGRPEIKGKIRRLQQELATRRMMEEVPKADVVVTNPTHYAVALRYEPEKMAAPRVVAKGVEETAQRIIALAAANKVATLSAPPLARALYFSTKINQQIPNGLYHAVARVLAYVFQLRSRRGGQDVPLPPADLPIPEELRRDL